jgi:hypothetical protein
MDFRSFGSNFGLFSSNFPGWDVKDFLLRSFTPHYFSPKVQMKLNVTINLESLIGTNVEQKETADAFILRSIEEQEGLFIYLIDIMKGPKVFMRVRVEIERDPLGNLTNKIRYRAFLMDEKLWPIKHRTFPLTLSNSDWKIVLVKEDKSQNERVKDQNISL